MRGRAGRGPLRWLRRRVRLGWAWALDYAYVGYWQVHGFLFRREAAAYARRPEGSSKPPVVLLPGIYENWQFMHPVAEHLHRAGHPVHVVSKLGYNRGTVPAMAALVKDYLEEQELRDVVLVAHSKGGLIGKYLMTMPGAGDRVARLVAVNSPFSGSVYADFFLAPSIRAFSPRNATLRQLRENLHVNQRITSVYSSFDPHIPGGSRLPGAVNIELESMGHFRVIGEARLLAALDEALSPSPSPYPSPSDRPPRDTPEHDDGAGPSEPAERA
ncbi:alpha/beta fold hydrolase [Zhihengliuella sp.]|uniref:esterase/lipase family protein n=1 Tax=Zhihengliuella sp. TaxID=1954483 RepID=UPI0028120394|nr:alpha/beta fold hydrolase [Zhihengliuella sp.]